MQCRCVPCTRRALYRSRYPGMPSSINSVRGLYTFTVPAIWRNQQQLIAVTQQGSSRILTCIDWSTVTSLLQIACHTSFHRDSNNIAEKLIKVVFPLMDRDQCIQMLRGRISYDIYGQRIEEEEQPFHPLILEAPRPPVRPWFDNPGEPMRPTRDYELRGPSMAAMARVIGAILLQLHPWEIWEE